MKKTHEESKCKIDWDAIDREAIRRGNKLRRMLGIPVSLTDGLEKAKNEALELIRQSR